jgi:hypothetical protein
MSTCCTADRKATKQATQGHACSSNFKAWVYNEQVAALIDMDNLAPHKVLGGKVQSYKLASPAMKLTPKEHEASLQLVAEFLSEELQLSKCWAAVEVAGKGCILACSTARAHLCGHPACGVRRVCRWAELDCVVFVTGIVVSTLHLEALPKTF